MVLAGEGMNMILQRQRHEIKARCLASLCVGASGCRGGGHAGCAITAMQLNKQSVHLLECAFSLLVSVHRKQCVRLGAVLAKNSMFISGPEKTSDQAIYRS
eukprot:scaffold207012_cov23-Cyclotella_meneghiniana.AAC.1